MAETSFPVVEQPLSDQQWGQVAEGFGSGILARGSEPYGIPGGGINNAENTVRIAGRSPVTGDGRAVVSGYVHRYDTDVTLSVPAVTSVTTYRICLLYDPTKHASAGGPVKLTVVKGALPTDGGKVALPIYRIVGQANQLLTDATITDERVFVNPSITVRGAELPPGDSVLTYTIATDWLTGESWQVQLDGSWKRIGGAFTVAPWSMGGWSNAGSPIVLTRLPDGTRWAEVEVELQRTGAAFTQGTAFISHGTLLPTSVRSSRGIMYCPAMIGTSTGVVALNTTTGLVQARLYSGTTTMTDGARISFSAKWQVK